MRARRGYVLLSRFGGQGVEVFKKEVLMLNFGFFR